MEISKMTVKEIEQLTVEEMTSEFIDELRTDERVSIQKIVKRWEREKKEQARVQQMYYYECKFYAQGYNNVAGIDEAGRGPLAGPLSVAAVILPKAVYLPKINDSKKLSPKVREELYKLIWDKAVAIAHSFIYPEEIDEYNIYQATHRGMLQTVNSLSVIADAVLVDAMPLPELTVPYDSLIKGDAKSASIAAASIIAKVKRDHYMDEIDKKYPMYGFANHKGYGTAEHITALKKYGPCPIHRKTFEPVKSLLGYNDKF